MIKADINELIEKIAKLTGISKEEVERRIEAKREKLSGLISREGAAQIVAAELGIKFDNIKLSIADLLPGMKRVNVLGKIIEIYGVRNYRRNDKELKVASFLLADSTDAIRVVLWDTNHIALIEQGKIKKEDTIEISNAYVRGDVYNKELHLTNISEISLASVKLDNVVNKEKYVYRLIDKLTLNSRAKIKANVVQVFKPHLFDFCSVCNAKVNGVCEKHENEAIEKRVLFTFIVDDGSSSIRCLAFKDQALKMLEASSVEEIENKISNLLGEEFWFEGRVRKNEFRNELEFIVDSVEKVDVKELIEKLQSF